MRRGNPSTLLRGVRPEALASRKVVSREGCTEGSETAKPGTDEQEVHKRHIDVGKQAQLCKARIIRTGNM